MTLSISEQFAMKSNFTMQTPSPTDSSIVIVLKRHIHFYTHMHVCISMR